MNGVSAYWFVPVKGPHCIVHVPLMSVGTLFSTTNGEGTPPRQAAASAMSTTDPIRFDRFAIASVLSLVKRTGPLVPFQLDGTKSAPLREPHCRAHVTTPSRRR